MVPKRKCSPTLRGMVVSNQLDKTEKKKLCKLKTSLSRNISGIVKCILRFCCKFRMKIIFYQTVNTVKPRVVAFLVFFCTSASFIAQISSSQNVSTASWFRSQNSEWPSYGSQSKRAKIAIYRFGKY